MAAVIAHRNLPQALLRAREAVMRYFRPNLKIAGVTEQQWRVIRVLSEAGTLDASEVADKASILAPSLTRMIRSLEERGVIRGYRADVDLTPDGDGCVVTFTFRRVRMVRAPLHMRGPFRLMMQRFGAPIMFGRGLDNLVREAEAVAVG